MEIMELGVVDAEYEGLTREQVARYLRAHPDYLHENPDLLRVLTPPAYHSGERVVDMQRFMVERLRQQIEGLQADFTNLIFSARDNMSAQAQMHEAVLRLLECRNWAELIDIVAGDLVRIFAVDMVKLCMEADVAPFEDREYHALQFVPTGTVKHWLGVGQARLGVVEEPMDVVFGNGAPMVASFAMVRLSFEAPNFERGRAEGLIAFGGRNPEQFHGGQGTELLRFLGRILEICIQRLWEQPARAE